MLQVWRNGVPVTGPCGDAANQAPACATACCDMVANTWTVQVSAFSEYVLAPPCVPVDGAQLTASRLDTPPGDDKLKFKGMLTLSATVLASLDPLVHGVGLALDNPSGNAVAISIPGGAFDATTGMGWRLKPSPKKWTYTNKTATPPGGLFKAVVQESKQVPGLVSFVFRGRKSAYPLTPGVGARLALPATGQCFGAKFSGPPPAPACTQTGPVLRCR